MCNEVIITPESSFLSNLNNHLERYCLPFRWWNTWLQSNAMSMEYPVSQSCMCEQRRAALELIVFALNRIVHHLEVNSGDSRVLPKKVRPWLWRVGLLLCTLQLCGFSGFLYQDFHPYTILRFPSLLPESQHRYKYCQTFYFYTFYKYSRTSLIQTPIIEIHGWLKQISNFCLAHCVFNAFEILLMQTAPLFNSNFSFEQYINVRHS